MIDGQTYGSAVIRMPALAANDGSRDGRLYDCARGESQHSARVMETGTAVYTTVHRVSANSG